MNRLTSFSAVPVLLLAFPIQTTQIQKPKPPASEVVDASAKYDWDADGIPDDFSLHVQKELDYSVEPEKTSRDRFWWYHCWLVVKSAKNGAEIWRDEWSVKEDDMPSFKEMTDFSSNREYFQTWFSIRNNFENKKVLNIFQQLRLTADDVDNGVLAQEIARLKIADVTPQHVTTLISGNPISRSFCYRATWREDLRCAVYVPKLGRAVLYQNGYR